MVWLHSLNGFRHDKTIVLLLGVVVSPLDLTVSVLACLGEGEGEFSEGGTEGRTIGGEGMRGGQLREVGELRGGQVREVGN